jgi:hypothetical protein
VVESGAGYTLSGKELDPESAAARPYLKGLSLNSMPKHINENSKIELPKYWIIND